MQHIYFTLAIQKNEKINVTQRLVRCHYFDFFSALPALISSVPATTFFWVMILLLVEHSESEASN